MKQFLALCGVVALSLVLRFGLFPILEETKSPLLVAILSITILIGGTFFVLSKAADTIEETTEVLSERTKLAGGLLQSLGTAFPDMVLGIIAALLSLSYRTTNWDRAINYAIIASATTFGSNIYNIGHAAWCIFRQNVADRSNKKVLMFPQIKGGGTLTPLAQQTQKPSPNEISIASSLLTVLTLLTTTVAIAMVVFGRVSDQRNPIETDLYQLIAPIGWVILVLAIFALWSFRKNMRDPKRHTPAITTQEKTFFSFSTPFILLFLLGAGIAILFTAESMVKTIEIVCTATHLPFIIAGVFAGIIGCLGEMLVVHNFSVHPEGRIGDAIVGVAMDNIVTIAGAAIVAIMGGIFLGGSALILIFVIILALNMVLLWQIGELQKSLLTQKSPSGAV